MLRLHSVGSCSIYGYRRQTKRAEDRNIQINRKEGHKDSSRAAAIFIIFPFAFRIVKQRRPANLPAGRTPEPFRQEAKTASPSIKGQKTF